MRKEASDNEYMRAIPETMESYGDASMGREHASQLNLLSELKAAVRGGAPDSLIYALLNDLVQHTNLHFLSEQLAMKLHAYEAYESHLLEHARLLVEVQNLKSGLATGTATDKQSLIEALRGWLVVHIESADKALAEYLKTRNVAQSTQDR